MEAMRSTKPGLYEFHLDAAARYVFLVNDAKLEGYRSITAAGTPNIWNMHYYRNNAPLKDGDLVLIDATNLESGSLDEMSGGVMTTNVLTIGPDSPVEEALRVDRGRFGERPALGDEPVIVRLGRKHGIGRLDLVENRYVGMKSRGCYETPGGTIMLKAHRAIESICLDREVAHLKDELMPRYASLIYNGYWWSPERTLLQTMIDASQERVNGWVRVKLYKGNVIVVGRDSKSDSLFDSRVATFEEDRGAYDQKDAAGFIKLNALRMRIETKLARKRKK
jgi:hypothetical protein